MPTTLRSSRLGCKYFCLFSPSIFHNTFKVGCHEKSLPGYYVPRSIRNISASTAAAYSLLWLSFFLCPNLLGQFRGPLSGPVRPDVPTAAVPRKRVSVKRSNPPAANEILIQAITQESEGTLRKLRGKVEIETTEFLLKADEVDYDDDTHIAEARGNVYFQNFDGGEELHADIVEYNMEEQTGKFYAVKGTAPARIEARRGILSSTNPFVFQGNWAEKIKDRYILYDGFITNCKIPKPWWRLTGPKFDIIPGDRALAYRSTFKFTRFPLFYTPVFYKSLEKLPRRSGLLTPSAGLSSRFGKTVNVGYFWAINRSYDLTYRANLYTQRGLRHHIDFRGQPNNRTDFNFIMEGIKDRGQLQEDRTRLKQGGYLLALTGRADELKWGFEGKINANYLSSFTYRQAFSQSFNEAIYSENNAIGFLTKNWSTYSFHTVMSRHQVFQSTLPDDQIVIRKLPSFEFNSRDKRISDSIPIWLSFESSASFMRRKQPLFETRQMMDRLDVAPRIMTAIHIKEWNLIPSFSARETHYGERRDVTGTRVTGQNLDQTSIEFGFDLIPPSIERTYDAPKWLGEKLKHVIEPRASFRYASGIQNFDQVIRFDQLELLSNTKEIEINITNRFFAKKPGGQVEEVLSWQVMQRRYFDPDFGGALAVGQRNVLTSTIQLTAYGFLDQRRNYSPIVSAIRAKPIPAVGIEWRADYDPLRGVMTNSSFTTDTRKGQWFAAIGHNKVAKIPLLSPEANQLLGRVGWGNEQHKGWNAGFNMVYDYRQGILQFAVTQVSYNSDCCGLSVQWRRFSFGTRNENQYLVSFAVANIGTFGNLRKQERLF